MKEVDIKKSFKKSDIDLKNIKFSIDDRKIGYLSGTVSDWNESLLIAKKVLKKYKLRNLVNDITTFNKQNIIKRDTQKIKKAEELNKFFDFDVVIIGSGVIGSSIARELSKYNLKIAVVEKEKDVACGATKANNGMIHPGNGVVPGTLKAKMNLRGNFLYTKFAEELGFKFERPGSFVFYQKGSSKLLFFEAWLACLLNKVPNFKLLTKKSAKKIDNDVPDDIKLALYTPTTGFVDGFEVCIAAAENAAENGVKFFFDSEVVDIKENNNKITSVLTTQGEFKCNLVINAAGIYADYIAYLANDRFYSIHPRKGVIAILDKNAKTPKTGMSSPGFVKRSLHNHSKGGGAEKTVSNNALFGPSAREVEDRDDLSVNKVDLDYAYNVGNVCFKDCTRDKIITYFAGLRASDYKEDFIIEKSEIIDNFIHVSAIQSPGLASAPAISEYVLKIVEKYYKDKNIKLNLNENFSPIRKKITPFMELNDDQKEELIKQDCRYANIICRCELITEGEIIECLHRPIPCYTIDGIKRRVRATAGRCQGGFCSPKLVEIISKELNIDPLEVSQKGNDKILLKKSREGLC